MKSTEKNIPKSIDVGLHYLNEPYQIIFRLRVEDKLSYKEIAKIVGLSENSCRIYVYRAKRKLFKLDEMLQRFKGDDEALKKLIYRWRMINLT
jgi:DNA-directed RNA polymerase specialized sigma24 family protein